MTHSLESVWTEFEGYVMRSIAETRVAKLLNGLGIGWVYEHMPYAFSGYLPDFYLPELDMFVEVKGMTATDEEVAKCERLHAETGCPVLLAEGMPSIRSWSPRLLLDGYWRAIPLKRIHDAIEFYKGTVMSERFAHAFRSARQDQRGGKLVGLDCDALRVSVHHLMDEKSREIYRHNTPVTRERLDGMRNKAMSQVEKYCHDFLTTRRNGDAS